MASFESEGLDEFINLCIFTDRQLSRILGRSIYSGAKLMNKAVEAAIQTIPTDDSYMGFSVKYGRQRKGITTRQLEGLKKSYGIAKIRRSSYGWNVKLGFDGYNDVISARWPKGQPNMMVARSINSGTSFMVKYPFMDSTVSQNEAATVKAIEQQFDKELEKIWNK